ncbi:hypothetical protein TSAR_012534 [Trichomalopsis sarcophagae]|uniref:Uncharacterized protein n=1 Tax=Trichomalopsis sarcophagae TaxID=543379 RepID=A0A232ETV2_9HYME|nr:hypothetical protein TSAR_012534 [Trichomalopsis sarcophagae]
MRNGQLQPRGYIAQILSHSRRHHKASECRPQQQVRRFFRYSSDPGSLLGRIGAIVAGNALPVSTGEPPLAPCADR